MNWAKGNTWNAITGIATLLGFFLVLFKNPPYSAIALGYFLFLLTIFVIRLFIAVRSYLSIKYPDDTIKVATIVKYTYRPGSLVNFQIIKFIQAKRPFVGRYHHEFVWTGSQDPQVIAHNHKLHKVECKPKDKFSGVTLLLAPALRFNESTIIHLEMKLDDQDHQSKPFVGVRIDQPLPLLQWTIELKDRNKNPPARIHRRLMSSALESFNELLASVDFDIESKAYSYFLHYPEVGYIYCIEWDK